MFKVKTWLLVACDELLQPRILVAEHCCTSCIFAADLEGGCSTWLSIDPCANDAELYSVGVSVEVLRYDESTNAEVCNLHGPRTDKH